MERIPPLQKYNTPSKLMFLLVILLASLLLSTFIGLLALVPFYGTSVISDIATYTDPGNPGNTGILKFMQIINQLGVFIIPSLLFVFLVSNKMLSFLKLQSFPGSRVIILSIILIFTMLPFTAWLMEWNQSLQLPASLSGLESWMKSTEQQAEKLTRIFLITDNMGGLLVNLLMMAVLPAIGEELLFRGVILRLLKDLTKNIHLAVIITAVLFSALHMQFYGFFPRVLLGLVFGYLFIWSESLWLPILLHFVNNASAVIAAFLYSKELSGVDYEDFGELPGTGYIIGSFAISSILLSAIYLINRNRQSLIINHQ